MDKFIRGHGMATLLIRLETKSCRILYGKLMVKYDRT